jgi:hypothetical protein
LRTQHHGPVQEDTIIQDILRVTEALRQHTVPHWEDTIITGTARVDITGTRNTPTSMVIPPILLDMSIDTRAISCLPNATAIIPATKADSTDKQNKNRLIPNVRWPFSLR